jgi:pimeloyl-ACP methyl ester carboxylesterase
MSTPAWFQRAIAAQPTSQRVDVQGCSINYLCWGNPALPPLVLVHGGAAHAQWWSFLAPFLMERYYVVALDLSGHGESGRRELYPRRLWADEVMGVIEHAGLTQPAVIVGHSMGGLVSMIVASVYGDRLRGAVIVDAPVRKHDPETERAKRGQEFRNPKLYPDRATAISRFRLVPAQPCENQFILDFIAEHSLREVEGGVTWKFDATVFRNVSTDVMADYLQNTRCRIALMVGEHSTVVPPETGEYMYELLQRNAPIIEIPDAHHHLLLDQPLAFIAALRALLADWDHSVPKRA